MKNLENYGIQTLNAKEIRETQGGGIISDIVHWLQHNNGHNNVDYSGTPGSIDDFDGWTNVNS